MALNVLTSRVGLPLVVAAVIVIGYEGLPIGPLRYIPFAGEYLAMITDGRVDRVRAQARLDVENESRARAMALIEQRSKDNAEISDLDAAHLCAELGGRWVPNETRCD
ncbi:MAG: hypothetical protein E5X53_26395 [Mesorhizobium sp.]|nr:hypothetical protein [Mesorhizobium sp.]TIP70594.1 MAG: hypothetical protein E5X55_26645 [Mesorhizobium sp.]TIR49028.1 MAG: hypothetical protein E5X53_26395 [Mesorhizobium sp.]TJV94863.1 MAG: hypothetical protein E5X52_26920 [Mesorhizobium sp.]